jgi:predicted PurR-regulated permease PerM
MMARMTVPLEQPTEEGRPPRVTVVFEPRSVRRTVLTVLGFVAGFLIVIWAFSVVGHFLFLLLLAWLFAIAMEPGIRALMRRGMGRGGATAVVGTAVVLAVVAFAVLFGDLFFTQLVQLIKSVPDIVTNLTKWVNDTFHTHLDPNQLQNSLQLSPSDVAGKASEIAGGLLGVLGSVVGVVFDLFTVVVFGFYFAADSPRLQRSIASWMRPSAQRVFINVWDIAVQKTGGYVVSKIELAALSTFFHAVFFWIIGVPYWLPFAIFVGITAQFIPVVGTYIGVAIPVAFTVFVSPWKALAIVIFAVFYQQIETYVFTPRVSRRTMDVNQAIALGSVFVGAAIWGPIGAIIGIPIAAAGVAIADTYRHRYELVDELDRADDGEPNGNRPPDGEPTDGPPHGGEPGAVAAS